MNGAASDAWAQETVRCPVIKNLRLSTPSTFRKVFNTRLTANFVDQRSKRQVARSRWSDMQRSPLGGYAFLKKLKEICKGDLSPFLHEDMTGS
jgi:hypothetical protein